MNRKYILLIVLAVSMLMLSGCSPKNYDSFVSCLNENGVTFYGAFWCPHCQNQKKLFGSSAEKLPYVECSTPDGKSQAKVCVDAGITSYPTWEFADQSRLTGEISLERLASKAGCKIEDE